MVICLEVKSLVLFEEARQVQQLAWTMERWCHKGLDEDGSGAQALAMLLLE